MDSSEVLDPLPRGSSRRRGRLRLVALLAVLAATAAACHLKVVSADPVNFTPHVLDGDVRSIVQLGNTVYLGGDFTLARDDDSPTQLSRSNFLAFDARTGDILPFAPRFDAPVDVIVPAADGQSLYVGGSFNQVDGIPSARLARISVTTGAPVGGFTVPTINGRVRDLRLVGNRLWLAGAFTHVGGVPQPALATINATTGAFDPFMSLPVTGTYNGGVTQVLEIDVTPDGRRLVAIGTFTSVGGRATVQVAALDIGGASATLANWGTSFFASRCASSFNTSMRDVDISPDGTWMAFVTTGGYNGGPPRNCDTISRFELTATGLDVAPTWVDYTGGDTATAVVTTPEAVYVGGHFRWTNNPFASNEPGPGAVSRPGIAALDTLNGLPLSWNPERTLGRGVFDLLVTDEGLWVGSDTDRIGNFEFHGRIAFFPYEGGVTLPHGSTGSLPGRVYLLDPASANGAVHGRDFDGEDAGAPQTFANGGINWDLVRGAVMIDGLVYAGFGDAAGSFVARSYDGSTWGPPDPVDTSDQLTVDAAWHNEIRSMTGLFFDDGRLYYTLAGSSSLFSRAFTPESQVVGAQRTTAAPSISGLSFADVRGMFLAGDDLYWATPDGNLHRVRWRSDHTPAPGTAEIVSGPTIDGVDWRARDLVLDAAGG